MMMGLTILVMRFYAVLRTNEEAERKHFASGDGQELFAGSAGAYHLAGSEGAACLSCR